MADYSMAMMGRQANPLGAYLEGVSAGQKQREAQRQREMQEFLQQQGPAIFRGEQAALEQLSKYDPAAALGLRETISQQGRAQQAHQLEMGEFDRVQQEQKLQTAISVMSAATTPEEWDAQAQKYDPSLVGQFARKDDLINQAVGLQESLKRQQQQAGAGAVQSFFGGVDEFNSGLSKTESGGNYSVVNKEGYAGKYQFGDDRIADYNRATGSNITKDEFTKNPSLQEKVQSWHVGDIDNFIRSNGLDQYVGQTIGGVEMTINGMRAMAHLGGSKGMKRYIESGGAYNPEDSNGTSLSDYARTHAGGSSREAPKPKTAADLAQLLQDPNVDPSVKKMALAQVTPKAPADEYGRYSQEEKAAGRAPLGRIEYALAKKGSGTVVYDPETGNPIISIGGAALAPPKLKEAEAKNTGFLIRTRDANKVLNGLEDQGLKFWQQQAENVPLGLGGYARTPEFQQFDQARRDFVNAILRRESGAVISDEEFDNANKQYFPVPGDSPEVIAQKRRNRENAIKGLEIGSGAGAAYLEKVEAAEAKAAEAEGATDNTDGANPYSSMSQEDLESLDLDTLTDEQIKQVARAWGAE